MSLPTFHHVPRLRYRLTQADDLAESMEDVSLPRGQRIQAWGATLLVTPSGVAALRLDEHPAPGVYERIQDAVPDFFGDAVPAEDEGRRGPEKRHQVPACARQRPEELHPWTTTVDGGRLP